MKSKRVLLFLTSHSQLGNTGKATGFHYTEMAAPYVVFEEAGCDVLLGSVAGGEPPCDPSSMDESDEYIAQFSESERSMNALKHTRSAQELLEIGPEFFDAIYLCGGHGTMWDFSGNVELRQILGAMFRQNKIISGICHGVVGLVDVLDDQGRPVVSGRKVTGFSNREEENLGLTNVVPFLLETRLKELGAEYACSEQGDSYVVEDGTLITGQNDRSAVATAEALVQALGLSRRQRASV